MHKQKLNEQMSNFPRVHPESPSSNFVGCAYEASLLAKDGQTMMYGIFVPQYYSSLYYTTKPRIHY
jgi:hypothetical protein